MKNLIPLVIYLVGESGLTEEEIMMLESEGKAVYQRTGVFIMPLEYEVEDNDKDFGIMAPSDAHIFLKDRDDLLHLLVDHAFDDLVDFIYWNPDEKTFYVKHPNGQVVQFGKYVRTKIKTDQFLKSMSELGEMLEEDDCANCDMKEECDAFNELMNEMFNPPPVLQIDVEEFPMLRIVTIKEL